MGHDAEEFVRSLAAGSRVLLMGGMAVIAHGLNRGTRDVDVWLEPFGTESLWATRVLEVKQAFPMARVYDLLNHVTVADQEAVVCVGRDGLVRIDGLDRPVDLFRVPNNLETGDFELCWQHAVMSLGDVRVMDEVDLLLTKEDTTRDQDVADVAYLERRIRSRLIPLVRTCDVGEADAILSRYADAEVCKAAIENPSEAVRKLAKQVLDELTG